MSILLDALKKSEAQRQLGKTPTLHSPVAIEESSVGGNRIWIPAVMVLLTAAVIAWIGITQFHRSESVAGALAQIPVVSQQVLTTDSPALEQADHAERSAKTPVMDYVEVRHPSVSPNVTRESSRAATRKNANSPSNTMESNSLDQQQAAAASPDEESLAVSKDTASPSGNEQDSAAETRQQRTDRLEPFVADSISFWQVPQSVREEIPEMRITVLVYAEKPEDRFLLINGQRLHEKEELGNGLVLEEIQRDRAIFNFHSYRFHLKN